MLKSMLLLVTFLSLVVAPAALTQDADKPTVAIMGYGWFPSYEVTEGAIFDMLQSYGFISAEESAVVRDRQDLEGEHIDIIWVEPGRGREELNLAVERVLDQEPDVLLTLSSWLTQAAVSATIDMADPPPVLFASVNYPYRSGIAESPCIKPDHVTGSESLTPFRYVMSLLTIQNPDIKKIGTMFNSSEEGGSWGVERIIGIAEE